MKFLKIFIINLIIALFCTSLVPEIAFASDMTFKDPFKQHIDEKIFYSENLSKLTIHKSQEDIDKDLEQQMFEINNYVNDLILRDHNYYSSEIVDTKYVTAEGYAGNQPPNGVRFPTGGGFFWIDNGGPVVSVGVSFSGIPYHFGVSLGIASTSNTVGYYVSVPNTYDYFKLYIYKTYRVNKVNIYKHSGTTPDSPKVLWQTVYNHVLDNYTLQPKSV